MSKNKKPKTKQHINKNNMVIRKYIHYWLQGCWSDWRGYVVKCDLIIGMVLQIT